MPRNKRAKTEGEGTEEQAAERAAREITVTATGAHERASAYCDAHPLYQRSAVFALVRKAAQQGAEFATQEIDAIVRAAGGQ